MDMMLTSQRGDVDLVKGDLNIKTRGHLEEFSCCQSRNLFFEECIVCS
jgi:hypothetical protein